MKNTTVLSSCDTFVVLPPASINECVIFGKNSDRPKEEVQEVVHVPASDHASGEKLQCTYIEIEQCSHTYATILSKPAWMWGTEMGANEHGVCIGNEAVYTKDFTANDLEEKLLGMDLVRLGLERGETAEEALDVICTLLEKYGQGGPCCENKPDTCYFNSFIIADRKEAWVLETSGKHWAAEKVTDGVRNISNKLSIGTKIDKMSEGLQDHAKSKGFWDGNGDFHFANVFTAPPSASFDATESPERRFKCGVELLEKLSADRKYKFSLMSMIKILRDKESGICRVGASPSVSVGSMVSVLPPVGSTTPVSHWLTSTPNPGCSVFKPFIFCTDVNIGTATMSPVYGDDDPAKCKPRFERKVDREHPLYKAHMKINPLPGTEVDCDTLETLLNMEAQCIVDVEQFLQDYSIDKVGELNDLFKDVVETEMKIYNTK